MRKNALTDVSVSKTFLGVIPPDPSYRERTTPSRIHSQHGWPCAGAQVSRMLRSPRIKNPPPPPDRIWLATGLPCVHRIYEVEERF